MLLALLLAACSPADKQQTYVFYKDPQSLSCFPNAEILSAEDRGLSDLRPFAKLTKLKKIVMPKNKVRDLSPLAGLRALEELDFGENEILDLTPLKGLTRLRVLKLMRNRIEDLTPLEDLANLEELWLYDNRVTDVSPLVGLKKLRTWEFERNAITNLDVLRKAGIPVSEHSHQYRGSCAKILREKRTDGVAICPPWDDAETAFMARPGCRLERICRGIAGIDCHSAADGDYDYVELYTKKVIALCGGRCMGGSDCSKNCPPKELRCN